MGESPGRNEDGRQLSRNALVTGLIAGALAYPVGLGVHTLYVMVRYGTRIPGFVFDEGPVYALNYFIAMYDGAHVGSGLLWVPGGLARYLSTLLRDPLELLVPIVVLTVAAWGLGRRLRGDRFGGTHRRRFVAGMAGGYLAANLSLLALVNQGFLATTGIVWHAVVIGVVYPAVFGAIGLSLARGSRRTTARTGAPAARKGGTGPICDKCGQPTRYGTICPHCGAER